MYNITFDYGSWEIESEKHKLKKKGKSQELYLRGGGRGRGRGSYSVGILLSDMILYLWSNNSIEIIPSISWWE